MGNAFITKGSTIKIGLAATDIKAYVIEDFDIGVGEQASEKVEASDGTAYVFVGEQADNDVDMKLLLTDSDFDAIMNSVYGVGTTVGGGTVWEMRNAGGTINDIVILSPATSAGGTVKFTAVNAKGVMVRPTFRLKKGFEASLKFICDYWTTTKQI